jgi:hypothetical protein
MKSNVHKKHVESGQSSQPTISHVMSRVETTQLKSDFFMDTTRMLIEANIPIEKLNNRSFREYLSKYTKREIPNPSNIRKHYVPNIYEEVIQKIREIVGNNAVYLIVDETSDAKNRYVVNIMVGILNGEPIKPMLLATTFVNKTNNKTISQCIVDSLTKLWSGIIHYDRLWLVVSDQASYLLKSISNLKSIFPNLKHITCIAHALHRVSCVVMNENKETNELISRFKQIMAKSPLRAFEYQEQTGLPLPPNPVITRWNTWLSAAFYYADNYSKVKNFIEDLNDSSQAIIAVKNVIKSQSLENQLLGLKEMKFLTEAITSLEEQNLKTCRQMEILNDVKSKLNGKCLKKLEKSLTKNPDIIWFTSDERDYEFKSNTKYAPLVSCDIERSFSIYKDILSDKRQNMSLDTIEYLNVICFNAFLNNN